VLPSPLRVVDVLPNVKPPTTTGRELALAGRAWDGLMLLDLSVALLVRTQEVTEGLAPTS